MRHKPFQKLPDSEKRTIEIEFRVTAAEKEQIRKRAEAKSLSVAEFGRRAMLRRRADVTYDMNIVSRLASVVQALRTMNQDLRQHGKAPNPEEFRALLEAAREAISEIE